MKSAVLPSFWTAYGTLDASAKRATRKAYRLWAENPFHPSLRFKCINDAEDIWAVRVTLGYRAVGVLQGDTVTGSGSAVMMTMNASLGDAIVIR